jgi:hypothetical protein
MNFEIHSEVSENRDPELSDSPDKNHKEEVGVENAELRENAKEILYEAVKDMYEYTMTKGIPRWVGYNAGIGFDVKGLDFFEPPMQKLLSLIHLKKDEMSDVEYMDLMIHSVSVLRNFDYQQEVLPEYQEEFRESGSLEIIDRVASRFEEAIELARK